MSKMKNILNRINDGLNVMEEYEFEDRTNEIAQNETQHFEKSIEKNEQSISELWDNFKRPIHVIGITEGKERVRLRKDLKK